MKAVILAGGLGTRLAEETEVRPKPMVEVGGQPLLWHIMKTYAAHGVEEFVVALGYKGDVVKRYFMEFGPLASDLTVSLADHRVEVHERGPDHESWVVHLVDTGAQSETGGRVARVRSFLEDEPFYLTYGDGLSNVDISALTAFHREQGRLATITAVHPPARFGEIAIDGDGTAAFTEKAQFDQGWINGGFMLLEPAVLDLIEGDATNLERDVLEPLSQRGEVAAYAHEGFWQCSDTMRDLKFLRGLWDGGQAPWVVW